MGPLLFALFHNQPEIAEEVLAAGADVTIQKNPDLNTALHQACHIGATTIVKKLLKLKDKVTIQGVNNHEWNMVEAENMVRPTAHHPRRKVTYRSMDTRHCIRQLKVANWNVSIYLLKLVLISKQEIWISLPSFILLVIVKVKMKALFPNSLNLVQR